MAKLQVIESEQPQELWRQGYSNKHSHGWCSHTDYSFALSHRGQQCHIGKGIGSLSSIRLNPGFNLRHGSLDRRMGVSPAQSHADLQALTALVGAAGVHRWDTLAPDLQAFLQQRVTRSTVSGILQPDSPRQVAEVMAYAHEHRWRVLPSGAGSKLDWGGLVQSIDLILSTQRLTQLIEHAVGDLTVTVEAGMRFAELQAILAQAGQFLAIDPAYPEEATIGGIVATADTGSLRQRYNGVRDMLLGLSFVRADGQIAKAGGRVVKNVAGYDLMKLLTGSYGTLGIITQVTLRVYPLPEASQTLVLSGAAGAIQQALQTLLPSALTPSSLDLLSPALVTELGIGSGLGLLVRFQSIPSSVRQQSDRLQEVGQALGLTSTSYTDAEEATLWQQLREHTTPDRQASAITCKMGVRPSDAVTVLQQIDQLPLAHWRGQIHAASGLGRLLIQDSGVRSHTLLQLRALCQRHGGFLSLLQAPTALKQLDVWGYTGNALALMRQLKQEFDPNALLSPHRFVGGI